MGTHHRGQCPGGAPWHPCPPPHPACRRRSPLPCLPASREPMPWGEPSLCPPCPPVFPAVWGWSGVSPWLRTCASGVVDGALPLGSPVFVPLCGSQTPCFWGSVPLPPAQLADNQAFPPPGGGRRLVPPAVPTRRAAVWPHRVVPALWGRLWGRVLPALPSGLPYAPLGRSRRPALPSAPVHARAPHTFPCGALCVPFPALVLSSA